MHGSWSFQPRGEFTGGVSLKIERRVTSHAVLYLNVWYPLTASSYMIMKPTSITMSLTHFTSTALITAFVLGAVANLSTSVQAILQYRHTQRNQRKTGFVSVTPLSLSARHSRTFTAVMITHYVIATGSALTFAVLMQERGDPWSMYLSSSVIISSMIRDVSAYMALVQF